MARHSRRRKWVVEHYPTRRPFRRRVKVMLDQVRRGRVDPDGVVWPAGRRVSLYVW